MKVLALIFVFLALPLIANANNADLARKIKVAKVLFDKTQTNLPTDCTSNGYPCESSTECCGFGICSNGYCDMPSGCVGTGGSCSSSLDCCNMGLCIGGTCE